jgi:hypothetical protein
MAEAQQQIEAKPVRVFISYAWESDEYRTLVKRFAKRLIADGIDVRLDAWDVSGRTIPEFMSSENRNAEKILIVCSPEYRRKVHAMEDGERVSGAGYESMLVASTLWTERRGREEVEVIVLQGTPDESIPDFLVGLDYLDLTNAQTFERNYRDLLRRLTGQRERAPKRGRVPDLTAEEIEPLRGTRAPEPDLEVRPPRLMNTVLDRIAPALNRALCRRTLPPEHRAVSDHMNALRGHIEHEIATKNWIPIKAKNVVGSPASENASVDPFVRPIHQVIRGLVGRSEGGDSATAQIAAVNRRSRVIRNIVKTLLETDDPLVLLGDPGTGKSLTLQQATLALIASQSGRVFPVVPMFVRLGEFHCDARVTAEDVLDYVKQSSPGRLRPWIEALDRAGRLVILFDGMDEMSRRHYTAHTEALSEFAASRRGQTKTLFSCRITDFSPSFVHRRLVLLPFDESQIAEYLRRYFSGRRIPIEGERWKIKKLARRLMQHDLPVEASNPFTLWLLCFHFAQNQSWPASRTALLDSYLDQVFRRKREDSDEQSEFPDRENMMREWSWLAYQVTLRNRGSAIGATELDSEVVRIGRLCGVLAESAELEQPMVRFEHHRMQEYFTARYIRDENPSISWLDKLDAPRWQETIVNLLLMGGGSEAVAVLASAILSRVPSPPAEGAIAHDLELLLADRVELAARIARAGNAPHVRDVLIPTVTTAVGFLMTVGNPITQMKMMRACIHLPDTQLLALLRRPLTSPVNWLREQALVLLSASTIRGGASLAVELGYDLENGVLVTRVPAYLRAIKSSHQRGAIRSLFLGLLALAIDLAGSAAIGVLLYASLLGVAQPASPDPWLTSVHAFMSGWGGMATTAALVVLAAIFTIRKVPEYLWAAIVAGALGVPLLTFAVAELWRAPGNGTLLLLGVGLALWLFAAPLLSLVVGSWHSIVSVLYVLSTIPFRAGAERRPMSFKTSWDRCGFLWWSKHKATSTPFGSIAASVAVAIGLGLLVILYDWVVALGSRLHLQPVASVTAGILGGILRVAFSIIPFVVGALFLLGIIYHVIMGLVISAPYMDLAASLVRAVRHRTHADVYKFIRDSKYRGTQVNAFRGWMVYRSKRVAKVVLVIAGCIVLLFFAAWLLTQFGAVLAPVLARVVAVLILLGFIFLLCRQSYFLWRMSFGQFYSFRPGSFTKESWKARLHAADSYEQEYILTQTNHETVGLDPVKFVALLQAVQPSIRAEPALSTYWARRADLEQALKQEGQE